MKSVLNKIIKEARENKGYSQSKVADLLGIKLRTYQYYEEGRNEPKRPTLNMLISILEIDPNLIYEQNVPQETKETKETMANEDNRSYVKKRNELKNNGDKKRIPFYDAPASGSDVTVTEMTAIHAPAGTIDVGDLLHDSEAAIRIYGNSMLPNYPPGCVVGLAKCNTSFIEPGEVYVIETRDRRILKRLFYKDDHPDADTLMCYSDNTMKFEGGARHGKLAYPPFNLPKTDIVKLYLVTGVIKRNANSVIINR